MRTTYWLINDEGNPNAQMIESAIGAFHRHSGFVIPSSFVIRHSSLKTMFHHLLLSEHFSNFPHG